MTEQDAAAKPGTGKGRAVSPHVARLMLLVNAAVWGSGYTIIKHIQATVPTQWMMAIRLSSAALLMGVIFLPRLRRVALRRLVVPGIILALTYWLGFLFQLKGLETIAPGRNAFLTDTYCVMVPFLVWAVTRRRPNWRHMLAAAVCIIGIGFVSLGGGASMGVLEIGAGDVYTIIGAFFFAANLVAVGTLARKFDPVALMFMEFVFVSLLFLAGAVLFDGAPRPEWARWDLIAGFAYLVIGSTIVAQIFQTVAIRYVPTSQASIILSTESIFGVLMSVVFYGERLTASTVSGFTLIFCAILLSELHPTSNKGRRNKGRRSSGTRRDPSRS
ncbi:DMT family transporter [Bifidobacterium catulorum]|uniref:EamA family transporter n=1 Tax=Bifidobacterium catulorum TaxID=1630173 RepID=A0A2U2MSE5_9BIFI|nr:DMT family transporter [Bifidobacterium catulorum]PWG59781.1 EamA family transporter [Bifidobacterium catulorum]